MTKTNVYTDGVWDLFHVSHVEFLRQIKVHVSETQSIPIEKIHLVVGVISDADVASYKRVPILNEDQRRRMVEACKHVDVVIPNSPLVVTEDLLDTHDISFVYHGNDSKQEEFFQHAIQRGIMRYIQYNDEISTTKIIAMVQARKKK